VKLANKWFAEAVYDFAEEDISTDKAFVGYKVSDALTVKLGFTKVPFGFEETQSSAKIPTIERSVAARFFADDIDFSGRHNGIHVSGDLPAGFSYGAAFVNARQGEDSRSSVNGTNPDGLGDTSEEDNDLAYFVRLQWANDFLTVGADYGNTGSTRDQEAVTVYANFTYNGLDLLAEYYDGSSDGEDAEGLAFRASYRIGKWEPVVRYAHLEAGSIDTDELIRRAPEENSSLGEGEIDSIYFGVNYHVSKATKFMFGYEFAEAEEDGIDGAEQDVQGFRARVQLLW